jgi:hypothetical protein
MFEGEGCISFKGRMLTLHITSTDYDVLDTVLAVAGCGHIGKEYRHKGAGKEHYKPFKRWEIRGIGEAQSLLLRLRPYLLERRAAKADEVLALMPLLDPTRPGRGGGKDAGRLCRAGLHPMNGKRYCYQCRNISRNIKRHTI